MKTAMIVVGLVVVGAVLALIAVDSPSGGGGGKTGELVATRSGLKYIDHVIGAGRTAEFGNTVFVHYTGTLPNGKKFDSSVDRNEPFSFDLGTGNVIKGWHEGVAGMKVGGKRKLVIPPDLAYGAPARPPVIPPNAELHFEIELLKVK